MNGKGGRLAAMMLIAVGGLFLLGKLGIFNGHWMSYLVPLAMVGLGYAGIRSGRVWLGAIVGGLGALVLLGKLASGLFAVLIAVGFIGCGIMLLTRKRSV